MSDFISLYPYFNTDLINKVFTLNPYQLKYVDDKSQICPLELKNDDTRRDVYYVEDVDFVWNHDDYGFSFDRKIVINNPSCLFGKGDNAIACANSTLGLAFQWASKTSSIRCTKPIGFFNKNDQGKEFVFSDCFDKCQLRGSVDFSIIIYLQSPGRPAVGEELFINETGYILGVLDLITIEIDGNGSILPVFYEDTPGSALWHVTCNISDASVDSFSDPNIVSITINRANPNFKFLDKKSDAYNPQMANEIMATAISMIIESLRKDDPNFETLTNPEIGSIADAVKYFRDVLSWDISNPITTNVSIREAFENKR